MKDLEHYNSFIPNELRYQNGGVYWSGRASVAQEAEIMLIALNPAGSPGKYPGRTVQACIDRTTNEQPYDWFEPRDARRTAIDTGSTAATAKHTMRRRVLHLIEKLDLDPSTIPAANLVFPRSRRKATLEANFAGLVDLCWPFHEARIRVLKPKVIVCLGKDAGRVVCKRIGATEQIGEFVERNNRKWRSTLHRNAEGTRVAALTHPSIADWTAPATDPTELLQKALLT